MMTVICPTQSTGLLQWSKLLVGGFGIDKDLQCGDVHLHCSDLQLIKSWKFTTGLWHVQHDRSKKTTTHTPIALGK